MMSEVDADEDEKIYYTIAAKKARRQIIKILEDIETEVEAGNVDVASKWAVATLSNCYFGLFEDGKGDKFEKIFMGLAEAGWEKSTFIEDKAKLFELTRK